MYEHLELYGVSKKVIEAMNKIDRKLFVPEIYIDSAYLDTPLPIGYGQTISAPHMVGLMCEYLKLKRGDKVLEIGTGSGYNAAVMSVLVDESGWVYSVERIEKLAQEAMERIAKLNIKNVSIFIDDGKKGLREYSPFNKISVTCYARDIPNELTDQLSEDGIMIIPVGSEFSQTLIRVFKVNGKIKIERLGNVRFVPMI